MQLAKVTNPGISRAGLTRIAGASRQRCEALQAPSGSNCVDVEVYTVMPSKPLIIQGTSKFKVSCADVFPLVEGIFGPLRVPLPATPCILDAEYGSQWRNVRMVKENRGIQPKMLEAPEQARRCVWPSVPLHSCEDLLGGYHGAGVFPSSKHDIEWRFKPDFMAKELQDADRRRFGFWNVRGWMLDGS